MAKIIKGFIIVISLFLLIFYSLFYFYEGSSLKNWKDSGIINSRIRVGADSLVKFIEIDSTDFISGTIPDSGAVVLKIADSSASAELWRSIFKTPNDIGNEYSLLYKLNDDTSSVVVKTSEVEDEAFYPLFALYLLRILIFLSFMAVGLWAFYKRPESGGVRALALFSLAISGFLIPAVNFGLDSYAGFEPPFATAFKAILSLFSICFGAFWVNLHLLFPKPHKIIKKYPKMTYTILYLPTLIGIIVAQFSGLEAVNLVIIGFLTLQIIAGFFLLAKHHSQTKELLERRQTRLVLWGSGMALTPLGILFVMVLGFGDQFQSIVGEYMLVVVISVFAMLLFLPISFAYAFGKYRLLEVEGKIRRATRQLLITIVMLIILFVFIYFLSDLLLQLFDVESKMPILIMAMILIIGFTAFQRKVQITLEKWIYPERTRLKMMLHDFLSKSLIISDRDIFWNELESKLKGILQVDQVFPVLQTANNSGYTIWHGDMTPFQNDSNFINELSQMVKRPLMSDEVVASEKIAMSDSEKEWFKNNEIAVILPMVTRTEIKGFLAIGTKSGDKDFEPADFEILQSLTSQVAIADENICLIEENVEKKRMEGELQIARLVQERMLPSEIPSAPGLDLAGKSLSCYEVAGDYYDIVKLDENRTVMAIGDVSGKGAGAALLMSNMQASFRTAVNLDTDLINLVSRMNDLIYSNSQPDQFITFFICSFDKRDSKLTYINAGHNPPYLIRTNGTIEELTEGGILLGAAPSMPFAQGEIILNDKDVVFMFTDGLSEAWNNNNEMYGEDRVIEYLKKYHAESAESLMDRLEEDINNFIGDEPLSDDFTIIIAKGKK